MTQQHRLWQADGRLLQHFHYKVKSEGLTPEALDDHFTYLVAEWLKMDALPLDWTEDGIAIVTVSGPLYKSRSPFATNYRALGDTFAKLLKDPPRAVVLKIDSPGGMADGLAPVVAQVDALAQQTLVVAHVDEMCCSAAYRIASQAGSIWATSSSDVGSIGTYAQLIDYSKAFEAEGLESVLLTTGPFKGVGVIGEPITKDQRAWLQQMIDGVNAGLLDDVQRGRDMTHEQLTAVSDGRYWSAAAALDLKLIDSIGTLEDVLTLARAQTHREESDMTKQRLETGSQQAAEETTPVSDAPAVETPQDTTPPQAESTSEPAAEPVAEQRTLSDYMEAFGDAEGARMFRDGVPFEDASAQSLADVRGQLQDAIAERNQLRQENERLLDRIKELSGVETPIETGDDAPKKTVSFAEAAQAHKRNRTK